MLSSEFDIPSIVYLVSHDIQMGHSSKLRLQKVQAHGRECLGGTDQSHAAARVKNSFLNVPKNHSFFPARNEKKTF